MVVCLLCRYSQSVYPARHFPAMCLRLALIMALAVPVPAVYGGSEIWMAKSLGNNMVLQHSGSQVWGWANSDVLPDITVTLGTSNEEPWIYFVANVSIAEYGSPGTFRWSALLPAMIPDNTPYTVMASISANPAENASITNVLFGDVWLCSGQSNMAFLVEMAMNGTEEVQAADNYPDIRLFTTAKIASDVPLHDLEEVEKPWSPASSVSISMNSREPLVEVSLGDDDWLYFSATCWFFGRGLFEKLRYPVGLVNDNWGGTVIAAWSSPDALATCNSSSTGSSEVLAAQWAQDPTASQLYNSMIHPLLPLALRGVVWYQGESDAYYLPYDCWFPAMIDDWRSKFSSWGPSDPIFPFGFVQLAGDPDMDPGQDFADLRWKQTAKYGYVPNPRQPSVFMAAAHDLGDPDSPYGAVHPRYKQDVGGRLTLSALTVAYEMSSVYSSGPIASKATLAAGGIRVIFQSIGNGGLDVRDGDPAQGSGWELCFHPPGEGGCDTAEESSWSPASALLLDQSTVLVTPLAQHQISSMGMVAAVRYDWSGLPCNYKQCGIYSATEGIPAPPFVLGITRPTAGDH